MYLINDIIKSILETLVEFIVRELKNIVPLQFSR